jgi:hypothetical protein
MELSTMLSEAFGDDIEMTLIDKSDSFYFGFSKLDVMFGRTTPRRRAAALATERFFATTDTHSGVSTLWRPWAAFVTMDAVGSVYEAVLGQQSK